ncbi:ROK family transcriptional regulator [Amaricoccus sp.]|uniref:ROK family transcriptional regulator n=1 Tax=Amaricoccus sp. TaxID=1872485 RepID=UPI0026366C21|nr:ROK family transcriptional regulator [uncultured Amaricoccus sp.]
MASGMEEGVSDDGVLPIQRGTNQAGMRAYNERLVLTLVRQHGSLAKTDIARMTGLSAQTVSVIMRHLEADRLLRRGQPLRGRVGQPSVPLSINPDGAFFIGVKIGRRGLDIVLVDFVGAIRRRVGFTYAYPVPAEAIAHIIEETRTCAELLGPRADRIAGIGVAQPFALWEWAEAVGAPVADLAPWRHVDIRAELAAVLPYPVYLQNDATAACGAELAFGDNSGLRDFLYFYIGTFIGGGLVLNGGLFTGRTGNAAALGSMPVPDGKGGMEQLINQGSLVLLERRLVAAGLPIAALYDPTADWNVFGEHLDAWLATAARGIAHAIVAASATIDVEAAVIDGAFTVEIQQRLLRAVGEELGRLDLSGIDAPLLLPGSIGPVARALGGASLPLFDHYLVERHASSALRGFADPLSPDRGTREQQRARARTIR